MEKQESVEQVIVALDNGETIDLIAGLDRLFAYAAEHKCEPGTKRIIDCPICGKKTAMTYVLSPYNGHLHAGCTACHVSIMQ